jgi:hypothetical protein
MEVEYVKTSDLDLASTLYTVGFPIDGIYNSNRKTPFGEPIMDFYFRDEERLRNAMNQYYRRTLRVEPSELFRNRKEILDRVKHEESVK